MSSIYEHLARAEAEVNNDIAKKLPKIQPASEPKAVLPVLPHHKPRLFGFKLLIMFALLFSVGSAAASVYFFQAMNRSQQESAKLEQRIQELNSKTQGLSEATADASDSLVVVRTDLDNLTNENSTLRSTLNRTRLEMSSMQQKVVELQGRSGAIEADIEKIKEEIFFDQKEKTPAFEAAVDLPRVVSVPSDVEKMEETSAEPADAQNASAAAPAASVEAEAASLPPVRIMTINRKFNFVVVNAGLKDNLRMGDQLEVKRGNKSIARVEIEKLYDDFSAATIVNEKKDTQIEEGDAIVLS